MDNIGGTNLRGADSWLPAYDFPRETTVLPVHAHLFRVWPRGLPCSWILEGVLADGLADFALQSFC